MFVYVLRTTINVQDANPNAALFSHCNLDTNSEMEHLVAHLVAGIDGRVSVAELLAKLGADLDAPRSTALVAHALTALQILYVDGTVADLHGV